MTARRHRPGLTDAESTRRLPAPTVVIDAGFPAGLPDGPYLNDM